MGYTDVPAATNVYDEFNLPIKDLLQWIEGPINETTLLFFRDIWKKHPIPLRKILTKLKKNTQRLTKKLNHEHLSAVVHTLNLQAQLPSHLIEQLTSSLKSEHFQQWLNTVAFHDHRSPRWLKRTRRVARHSLGLSIEHCDVFEQLITGLVYFDDDEPSQSITQRALRITRKLSSVLAIECTSPLSLVIEYIAHRVMLATNVMESNVRSMSLNEVYLLLDELMLLAKPMTNEHHRNFVRECNALMLTINVCQQKPSAFFDLATVEHDGASESTLKDLEIYFKEPLVLHQFFKSQLFSSYFSVKSNQVRINSQAFLMSFNALTPDLEPLCYANLIHLIRLIQKLRIKYNNPSDVYHWFHHAWKKYDTHNQIKNFLFSSIEKHVMTHLSQLGSLVFSANKLITLGFAPRAANVAVTGRFQPLISPDAAFTDAKNIKGMKLFYDSLPAPLQNQLLEEICFAIALQSEIKQPLSGIIHIKINKKTTSTIIHSHKQRLRSKPKDTNQGAYCTGFFSPAMNDIDPDKPLLPPQKMV